MIDRLHLIREQAAAIARPVRIMEVCGTHTVAAFRAGIRALLPPGVSLISGPGCPVCVTPTEFIDQAIALSKLPATIIATYGDMLRVPGTDTSLERARAGGGDVRVVYSAEDALILARANPGRTVVFLGVGFETTTPPTAWVVRQACGSVSNFKVLSSHKTMPRAMAALVAGPAIAIDGVLCPGHVSVIIGSKPYEFLARDHHMPCVITGFDPADILAGIAMILTQVAEKRAAVEIQYTRSVKEGGNLLARRIVDAVMMPGDALWRGLGMIPGSGMVLRPDYAACDAMPMLRGCQLPQPCEPAGCMCGDVLKGLITPPMCPMFGTRCTPSDPVGPCMVSSEGSCAAFYKYGR